MVILDIYGNSFTFKAYWSVSVESFQPLTCYMKARQERKDKKKGKSIGEKLGTYRFATKKVSENFNIIQIKMTDLPVPSSAPARSHPCWPQCTCFKSTCPPCTVNMKSTVLDSGYQIILANWPRYEKIMCSHNNNILISIPSHPYVQMNRSILCNCDIKAESNFLLESLAVCENSETKNRPKNVPYSKFDFCKLFWQTIKELAIHILRIGQPRNKFCHFQ